MQQEILVMEKVLVEGLRFDLLVELPYAHLLKFIKLLQGYMLLLLLLSEVTFLHARLPLQINNSGFFR